MLSTSFAINPQYDFIVLGGGSAGCVIASRLSEDPACRVLLVEAGGDDLHPDVRLPLKWRTLFPGELDWGFQSIPMEHCNYRIDHVPRAKMLGGCHSHNATAWVRGHPSDFDAWAYQGCHGWAWADVLPIFKRIEDWHGPASPMRGSGGPIHVEPPIDPNPIAVAFALSGPYAGLPAIPDCNGSSMEGTTLFNMTAKNGERFSVVDGYLRPAMQRNNLTVALRTETIRLVIEKGRCIGAVLRHGGQDYQVTADEEVILSCGVIGSPTILLRSGIGPASQLHPLGIDVAVDLPGVGKNLQDHPLCAGVVYEAKADLPPEKGNGVEGTLWWRSRSGLIGPDIQPMIAEFPFTTSDHASRLPNENCYTLIPSVVRPASRGSITLADSDPDTPPVIIVNYYQSDTDLEAQRAALNLCRELGASEAFREFRHREVMPGSLSKADMTEFIKNGATTYFHPTSTCKMGVDHESVVDPQLRVYGIEGLRIADASIMPQVTSGNTNAPTIMIAERCSDLLKADIASRAC